MIILISPWLLIATFLNRCRPDKIVLNLCLFTQDVVLVLEHNVRAGRVGALVFGGVSAHSLVRQAFCAWLRAVTGMYTISVSTRHQSLISNAVVALRIYAWDAGLIPTQVEWMWFILLQMVKKVIIGYLSPTRSEQALWLMLSSGKRPSTGTLKA